MPRSKLDRKLAGSCASCAYMASGRRGRHCGFGSSALSLGCPTLRSLNLQMPHTRSRSCTGRLKILVSFILLQQLT